jgi:uncharacterized delta-60 repeat protein
MKKLLLLATVAATLSLPGLAAVADGAGRVDRGFGENGRLMLPARNGAVAATALLPDRRTIVATRQQMLALLPSGSVDRGFGENGVVSFARPPGVETVSLAALLVDSQGRLLAVGDCSLPSEEGSFYGYRQRVLVERYTPAGQLDRSFGEDGVVVTDLGLPPAEQDRHLSVMSASAALDREGRIVLTGRRHAGYRSYKGFPFARYEAFVGRLTAEGEADGSFADGGALRLPGLEHVGAPAIDEQGGVYLVASGDPGPLLTHLQADGSPDPAFGENGRRPLPKRTHSAPILDGSGRLLLYGYLSGWRERRLPNGILIKRLRPDGSLDRSFGQGGAVGFRLERLYTAQLGVDERDRLLVAASLKRRWKQGRHPALPPALALARLRPGGGLDAGFGHRGVLRVPLPGSEKATVRDLDLLGDDALLRGVSCGKGDCGAVLARIDLGSR